MGNRGRERGGWRLFDAGGFDLGDAELEDEPGDDVGAAADEQDGFVGAFALEDVADHVEEDHGHQGGEGAAEADDGGDGAFGEDIGDNGIHGC